MNPGKLNTRIAIKNIVKSSDGYGGFTNTITTTDTIWGDVKEVSGKRDTQNGQRSTKTQVEVICRAKTIDNVNSNANDDWTFEIEGSNYRVNEIYESELKYYTKIIGTKIN